jgi:hypothetical protein
MRGYTLSRKKERKSIQNHKRDDRKAGKHGETERV